MAVKFFVHHEKDTVGVAVADIKAGETAAGWVMDNDSVVSVKRHSTTLSWATKLPFATFLPAPR